MNTEILETLDLRRTNELLLMRHKETHEPIMYVLSAQAYDWPEGYKMDEVEFIEFSLPPQEDSEEDFDQHLPEMRDCKKGCGGKQFAESTCCSERAAGYQKKWVCDTCKHTTYSRKG
jgi:hypothetical protein